MAFEVELSEGAQEELDGLRAFDHRRVLESIASQLTNQPNVETRNRKRLGDGLTAKFEYIPPLWELRVGKFRVFYEIDEPGLRVIVHAVREKPPGKTTAEVLDETG
jgi:mRNA-degrading endonuclease RelE of RelBE toxin-antitoxin system